MPALAVADALRAKGALVSFLGTADRAEAELVPAAGYEIDHLRVRGVDRSNPLRAAGALALAARAVPAARAVLVRRRANVVLAGGGYVAAPAGLAALGMRLPVVVTEADRRLGLANRMLARRASRVCLAFPIAGRVGERYLVTGRPIPAAIATADRGAARTRFGIGPDDRCLLVFGGSQGARSINHAALDGLLRQGRGFDVLHISGERDYEMARERVEAAGASESGRYTLISYEPGLADAMAASDLALARSGASVFELAAAGLPAILVPYPYATGRHQHANAEWMASAGAAVVIEDADLTGDAVATLAAAILADDVRLKSMADASTALAMPDAADRVAGQVLEAVRA